MARNAQELVDVEHVAPSEPGGVVVLRRGTGEFLEPLAIVAVVARLDLERVGDVLGEAAVVEIALRVLEVSFEELFVPALHQDVELRSTPV
jgi:hypothetical protein